MFFTYLSKLSQCPDSIKYITYCIKLLCLLREILLQLQKCTAPSQKTNKTEVKKNQTGVSTAYILSLNNVISDPIEKTFDI